MQNNNKFDFIWGLESLNIREKALNFVFYNRLPHVFLYILGRIVAFTTREPIWFSCRWSEVDDVSKVVFCLI